MPARIVNVSHDVSVNEGDNVNLFCLAVGRPEPTVTWKDQKCKKPASLLRPLTLPSTHPLMLSPHILSPSHLLAPRLLIPLALLSSNLLTSHPLCFPPSQLSSFRSFTLIHSSYYRSSSHSLILSPSHPIHHSSSHSLRPILSPLILPSSQPLPALILSPSIHPTLMFSPPLHPCVLSSYIPSPVHTLLHLPCSCVRRPQPLDDAWQVRRPNYFQWLPVTLPLPRHSVCAHTAAIPFHKHDTIPTCFLPRGV